MIDEDYVLTLHPEPAKQGVWIEKAKYDMLRKSILDNLHMYGPLTFTELGSLVEDQLKYKLDGSIMGYYTAVKLDVEARGEIHRVPDFDSQLLKLSD